MAEPATAPAPSAAWSGVVTAVVGTFCLVVVYLALQVRAGADPAIGAGPPAAASKLQPVVVRRIVETRVVRARPVAAAPSAPAQAGAPAATSQAASPPPAAAAPAAAPAPAPAPAVSRAS